METSFLLANVANVPGWRYKERIVLFVPAEVGDCVVVGSRDKRLHCSSASKGTAL